ncbi:MAG: hypothetical protein K2L42_04630 [Clostridia bacterium]|nr:hypothetical protein [Clostridia bacterium]
MCFLTISFEQILTATEIKAVDWSQFVPSVLATVIGFFLAIVFQQGVYEFVKNIILNGIKANGVIIGVKKELDRIAAVLGNLNDGTIYVDPIKIPVWDGILNANEFELLRRFKKVKLCKRIRRDKNLITKYGAKELKRLNFNLYDLILSVYGVVQEYNKWWYIYSENYAEMLAFNGAKEKMQPIKQCIKEIKSILLSPSPNNMNELGESVVALSNLIECTVNHKEYKNKELKFDLNFLFKENEI